MWEVSSESHVIAISLSDSEVFDNWLVDPVHVDKLLIAGVDSNAIDIRGGKLNRATVAWLLGDHSQRLEDLKLDVANVRTAVRDGKALKGGEGEIAGAKGQEGLGGWTLSLEEAVIAILLSFLSDDWGQGRDNTSARFAVVGDCVRLDVGKSAKDL